MRLVTVFALLTAATACTSAHYATVDPGHPAVVVPHHIAEGDAQSLEAAPAPPPAQAEEPAEPPPAGFAPDPAPLRLAEQWQYAMIYQGGSVSVEHVEKRLLEKPTLTPRRMGRYALELWIGHELVDRVRFDFPLIGAEPSELPKRRPLHDPPSFSPHAVARIRVLVPASRRATRLLLVDRASAKSQELPWPPEN